MKLIVGLGNPGREYENTRHNIGFQLLDVIANRKGLDFNNEKFNAKYCECNINGEKVLLIKPLSLLSVALAVFFDSLNKFDFLDASVTTSSTCIVCKHI